MLPMAPGLMAKPSHKHLPEGRQVPVKLTYEWKGKRRDWGGGGGGGGGGVAEDNSW